MIDAQALTDTVEGLADLMIAGALPRPDPADYGGPDASPRAVCLRSAAEAVVPDGVKYFVTDNLGGTADFVIATPQKELAMKLRFNETFTDTDGRRYEGGQEYDYANEPRGRMLIGSRVASRTDAEAVPQPGEPFPGNPDHRVTGTNASRNPGEAPTFDVTVEHGGPSTPPPPATGDADDAGRSE